MSTTRRIRILLADDHPITRDGTRRLLEAAGDFEIVAECGDGEDALRLTHQLRPDLVVLDISMPRLNGIEAAQAIRRRAPATRLVVLTGYESAQYANALVRLGVDGYLLKTATSQELIHAVRAAYEGHGSFPVTVLKRLSHGGESPAAVGDAATPRELEVLRLVAEGQRNRDIARKLGISERTTQFHLHNLFAKLQVGSRTELVHRARQQGWLS